MSPPGDLASALLAARRKAYAERLEGMNPEDRWNLVDRARAETKWPNQAWLQDHAMRKGAGRTVAQYREWTQAIKRRPGTLVYAIIHVVHGNEGLAFIDPRERSLVWYHLEWAANLSCLYIEESLDDFIASKGELYWRLPDTELN